MSREQKRFFIGDFGPYKYLSTLAPFALSLTDDPSGLQAFTTYKRLLELLEYVERIDRRQHEYAVANFYEYQQLWAGMSSFIEFVNLRLFAGLHSTGENDRVSYLKSQARTHLHNFLLSQKAE
jgi:hypothetical protein